jgi:3-dehydroshikimate dehydratase
MGGVTLKRSVCTSGFKDWPIEHFLDWTRPLRLDGIELWMGHIERYQTEHGPLDKLKTKLQEYGLEVAAISGYTTFSGGFSGERNLNQEFISINRLMDVAKQLQSPLIRSFLGHVSSRHASPEQWGQIVCDIKKVLQRADQFEVDVAIEVHYDTFIDNTESAQMLMHEVDHPRLSLVFDGANLNVERIDQLDALSVLFSRVKHVHIKNYRWDHSNWFKSIPVSILEGDIDNRSLIMELEKRNYNGFISLEYFGEKREINIKRSLEELNQL